MPTTEESTWMQEAAGKDQILSQVVAILQDNNVSVSVINELMNLKEGIGEVTSIVSDIYSGQRQVNLIDRENRIADYTVWFNFPPNKEESIFSEFQRAQNNGFFVRFTYIQTQDPPRQFLIRSLRVFNRQQSEQMRDWYSRRGYIRT